MSQGQAPRDAAGTASTPEEGAEWSPDDAQRLYAIDDWGAGYFTVNEQGHLCVTPYGPDGPLIDTMDVVEEVLDRGFGLPCVIRFQDVLRSRVVALNETFRRAIKEEGYGGAYIGVFPIKVNQMREVVEEILDAGAPYHHGLEAGSKAELIPALALNTDPEALTIANGYKDEAFMRLALTGRKLGRKSIVVVEKLSELPLLLRVAREMGVEPMVGLRARLSTQGAGKWESSSGDFAKFGLSVPEILQAVRILQDEGMAHTLRLFHFHAGSQLTDIHTIKEAVREGTRIYAKLKKLGLQELTYLDVGGGLGVDYVGTRTTAMSSTNYGLDEYASDVIHTVMGICRSEEVPEPDIVSESGRAVTAHHSCIIMNIFGNVGVGAVGSGPPGSDDDRLLTPEVLRSEFVRELDTILRELTPENALASFHDAQSVKSSALSAFNLGILGLTERAAVEMLYWRCLRRLAGLVARMERPPSELQDLPALLADQYLANFSLFQSALDHWAFDQLFPVVPLHRLDEEPRWDATLVDITCDSDGKITKFVDDEGPRPTLPVHRLDVGKPYYMGMFLTGAYQDIMGDMHNLFGRANEIHVFVDDEDPQDFYVETAIAGDLIHDVLARVQYEPKDLLVKMKAAVDARVKEGHLKPKEGVAMVEYLADQMEGYTYLGQMGVRKRPRAGVPTPAHE